MARGRALAHPVPARQTDLAIQLHGMNLPTLPVTGKGSQTGRVLLRRSGDRPRRYRGLLLHRRLTWDCSATG